MSKTAKEQPQSPKLDAWNSLIEEIQLPGDFVIALTAGRSELLRAIRRPLTAEETNLVATALGVLIETNQALQRHAAEVARQAEYVSQLLGGAATKLSCLEDLANFRDLELMPDAGE